MKIKNVGQELPLLTDQDRYRIVDALVKKLCGVSAGQIAAFTDNWNFSRPFEEFCEKQNRVIVECVAMELSDVGRDVRNVLGLEPLDPEEELT